MLSLSKTKRLKQVAALLLAVMLPVSVSTASMMQVSNSTVTLQANAQTAKPFHRGSGRLRLFQNPIADTSFAYKLLAYTPPDYGGPDSSGAAGTRCQSGSNLTV